MIIFIDCKGRNIRLSEERQAHLTTAHPEMDRQSDNIELTVQYPDLVVKSKTDDEVELHYKFFDSTPVTSKYLCVVVKESNADTFIITVYFTDTVKKGQIIWKRQ